MIKFFKPLLKLLLWVGGILGITAAILNHFYVDRVLITHNGMAPTLLAGEEALVWRGASMEMGDIGFCEHPERPGEMVIGRVVGKPGMTIDTNRNRLRVEGTIPQRDVLREVQFYDSLDDQTYDMVYAILSLGNTDHEYFERKDAPFQISPTKVDRGYYILSDNRMREDQDSRNFGPVQFNSCRGKVFMRFKPVKDDGGADLGHGWLDIVH